MEIDDPGGVDPARSEGIHSTCRSQDQSVSSQQEWVPAVRAVLRAVDRAWQALAERTGLSLPEVIALELLHFDGQVPIRAVREATGLRASAVTAVIDRLERAGLARRVRQAQDRRQVQLELTELGHHHTTHLFDPLIEHINLTDRPTPSQTAALNALVNLLDNVAALVTTLPPLPPPTRMAVSRMSSDNSGGQQP